VKMKVKGTVTNQTKEPRIVLDQGKAKAKNRGLHREDIVIHQGSREPLMAMNTDRMSL